MVMTMLMTQRDLDRPDLDALAASAFIDVMLAGALPEAVAPTEDELRQHIAANWPVELGEGWLLGFDRNSKLRTMYIQYVTPDD